MTEQEYAQEIETLRAEIRRMKEQAMVDDVAYLFIKILLYALTFLTMIALGTIIYN